MICVHVSGKVYLVCKFNYPVKTDRILKITEQLLHCKNETVQDRGVVTLDH